VNPLDLNRLSLLDSLIYGLGVDTMSQSATLTLQLDCGFHKDICKALNVGASGSVLLDFKFQQVTFASFEGLLPRPDVVPDEPPHDYEVASWKVKSRFLRRHRYRFELRCYNAPRCVIEFGDLDMLPSQRRPGVTHDYDGRDGVSPLQEGETAR
jgi:hypothetical protein